MGVALFHRYKNNRNGSPFDALFELIDEETRQKAEVLGKALRFGAMLTASEDQPMGKLKYQPKKKQLELQLADGTRGLFGEVAEARLQSLAQSLGGVEVTVKGR